MTKRVKRITTIDELDRIIKRSNKKPVFIFKHDIKLTESEEAYQEYLEFIEENEEDIFFTMVDIRECLEVSEAIEDILDINHVAPQLILLMEEEVVWDDQQNNITSGNLIEVVNEFISI